ncbi:hypothetical protein EPH_0065380 [Eimeria praecox]|uniref:Uncharacterized protein n=1 Tax=Eimeria praecox TaxID=51316 RepID=U6H1L3_9EIME|nr:hypothetical protein EPH_0065380 [Eimeria praecox]
MSASLSAVDGISNQQQQQQQQQHDEAAAAAAAAAGRLLQRFALRLLGKLTGMEWKAEEAVEIIRKNFCLGK